MLGTVPVAAEDLEVVEAGWSDGIVQLAWRVSPEAQRQLVEILERETHLLKEPA